MKKILLPLLLAFAFAQVKSQSLNITSVLTPICPGSQITVMLSASDTFLAGNYFIVQLSNAGGSFSQPVQIGSATSDTALPVSVLIPLGTPAGTGYRMRAVSSNPVITGTDNGYDITIGPRPIAPTITTSGTCALTDSLTITGATGAGNVSWYQNYSMAATTYAYASTIVAGGNGAGNANNQFSEPSGVIVDAAGNIYASDYNNNRVMKFAAGSNQASNGVIVAGGNGAGTAANQLNGPANLYVDRTGNIFVVDGGNNRIQMFAAGSTQATNGVTVAGGNGAGSAANQFNGPDAVFTDSAGNIYVADYNNNRVQKFAAGSTQASNGVTIAGGNGAGAGATQLNGPAALFVDSLNNVFVADFANNRIQKFPAGSTSATSGVTVAGGNGAGINPIQLNGPVGVYVDRTGNIFVADGNNYRVEKFAAGSNSSTAATTLFGNIAPGELYLDNSGNIYIPGIYINSITKWAPAPLKTTYVPGYGGVYYATYTLPGGCPSLVSDTITFASAGTSMNVYPPDILCVGNTETFKVAVINGGPSPIFRWYENGHLKGNDSIYVTNTLHINNDTLVVSVTNSGSCGFGDTASVMQIVTVHPLPATPTISSSGHTCPDSLVIAVGNPFEVSWYNNGEGVDSSARAYTVAGNSHSIGSAANQLNSPYNAFADQQGNIYVADYNNGRVQKFPPNSVENTAGVTVAANQLVAPSGLFVDAQDNIYVSDLSTNQVLKYPAGSNASTPGVVVAGRSGGGSTADRLSLPYSIFVDGSDNVYVADYNNNRVQKFAAGSDSTTAGVTVAGGNGSGSSATQLNYAIGVCLDKAGNLYVADFGNFRVQKFPAGSSSATPGVTICNTYLNALTSVCADSSNNIYIFDQGFNRVTKIGANATYPAVGATVAGDPNGYSGAEPSQLSTPFFGSVDAVGNIYIADYGNNRVQKWVPSAPSKKYITMAGGQYTATYANSFGCSSHASNIISIAPLTPPAITQNGSTLSVGNYQHYQWLLNGTPLAGDTLSSVTVPGFGDYSVVVTDVDGCTATASDLLTGLTNITGANDVELYPNPNNGAFILSSANRVGNQITVYDLTGRIIYQQLIISNKQFMQFNNLAAGTYLLEVKGNSTEVLKFSVN